MTQEAAFRSLTSRFKLSGSKQIKLMDCEQYAEVIQAERGGDFNLVRGLLLEAEIIFSK